MDAPAFTPRCAECADRVGTSAPHREHKFSCNTWMYGNPRFPLTKRNPGLSLRDPDRALWPEVAHAKRTQQYRHPRST